MELSNALLKLLSCPVTGEKLIYDRLNKELVSSGACLAYPIIDSIPILLVDKARKIINHHTNTSVKDSIVNKINEVA